MDQLLIEIEPIAKVLLKYIESRHKGTYTGHATIEEHLRILNGLTEEALQKARIDPEWNKVPFQIK